MGLIRTLDRTYICRDSRLSLLQNVQKMDKTSQKPFIKQDMLSMEREAEMMKNMREREKHKKKKKKIKNLLAYKTTYFFPRTLVVLS